MRSRTGCLTCRQRKLKCDEQKPTCGQCRKASRECQPSSGIVFRHQQNASMNGGDDGVPHDGNLKGFYAYKNTFDEDSVWLEVPKQVTFIDNSDPYAESWSPELEESPTSPSQLGGASLGRGGDWDMEEPYPTSTGGGDAPSGLHALSAAASGEHQSFFPPSIPSESSLSHQQLSFNSPDTMASVPLAQAMRANMPPVMTSPRSASPSNNINFLLNPPTSASMSLPIDPNLPAPLEHQPSSFSPESGTTRPLMADVTQGPVLETDHEVAFLLRHFSEGPGQWMDLFDEGCYFAQFVPGKALSNPLLKYAALAYAAKQLGRVQGQKPVVGGTCAKQARMELYPDADKTDWYYKAAAYNDKAISLLMDSLLEGHRGGAMQNSPEAPWRGLEHRDVTEFDRRKRRRVTENRTPPSSDECLAATVILSVQEFLDHHGFAWSRHLNGTKTLLDIAETGMMPLHVPSGTAKILSPPKLKPSKARKATFWNFARQDFLAAFINECQTRTDTENLSLWTAAGLLLDGKGFVLPSNVTESGYPEGDGVMREDLIGNALIWLMSKLINFLAAGDGFQTAPGQTVETSPVERETHDVNQNTLLQRWKDIEKQIDVWHDGLPDTFRPCARVEPARSALDIGDNSGTTFSEIWYSIPMCASTMQSYHMARILLLINKPHESTAGHSSVANRLSSYRAIESEIRYHSYEICGIALSRPEASVRIHQLQPLFVAGQCLADPRERRVILDLLRGIERDLGWATEYRVKKLLREWGWGEGSGDSS